LQNLDVSEGERKREGLGLVAAMVCSSTALKGSFYRHGRGRELGFLEVVEAGKFSGCSGSAANARSMGRLGWVLRLLRMRYSRLGDLGNGRLACALVG
jgi:hypothetical protein